MITPPTIFFQLPVAIHLPLSLNPVAAVCPQSGLGLSNHGSAWGETGRQLREGEVSLDTELQTTVNVTVDLEQWPANPETCERVIVEKREGYEETQRRRQHGDEWWIYN